MHRPPHDFVGVGLVFLRRALPAGIHRAVGPADDDPHPAEQALFRVDEHGYHVHPRADGHHGRAALDLRLSRVLHPGALREDQQIPSLLQALNGGFHRQNVRVAPIHGKHADGLENTAQDGNPQQLLFGHDPQGITRPYGCHKQNGIPGAAVVGAQHHRPVIRQILRPLQGNGEQKPHQRPQDFLYPDKMRIFHSPARLLMVSSSSRRLSSKVSAPVSSSTASSALHRGAMSRWESAQSRSTMSRSTCS